jgi:hypothetical protein
MRFKLYAILGFYLVISVGCKREWPDYFDVQQETVDTEIWDALQNDPEISMFVQMLKDNQLDTLFQYDNTYTIITPTNSAIESFSGILDTTLLKYHIFSNLLNSTSINGKRKIQTLTKKFALFERYGGNVLIDGIEVQFESPLYRKGRYFAVDNVIEPKPNLYEYFRTENPILTKYINSQDSIVLDKEQSKPIGFDELGNTIYDSVSIIYNIFEDEYFPVKQEFRDATATIVFPKAEDYINELDVVADALGSNYNDHRDIPEEWQNNILVPHLIKQGVFLNMLEPEEFIWMSETDTLKLLNVLGDSIIIDYTPTEKAICSNGYAYNYQNFQIPDSLYSGSTKLEAELLTVQTGINRYAWSDSVNIRSTTPFEPVQELVHSASGDSIIRVIFPKGYSDEFSVEFNSPSLFPRKYIMVVGTHMDIGGIYDIYVNDELIKTFDYYQFILYRGIMFSVVPGKIYKPTGRFNSFDMYVENIVEYGQAKIRFEYKEPGSVANNGLVLDYIEFIPAE